MRHFTFFRVLACASFLLFSTAPLVSAQAFSDEEVAESSSMNDLDTPPKPVKQVAPTIPPELHGIRASVQVGFIIDEKGRVLKPRVIQSSSRSFDEISLRCIRQWEFTPGLKNGTPVKVRVIVPLRYK